MKKYKTDWDYTLLYKSKADLENDINKLKKEFKKIKLYKGKLNTKENILAYLKLDEEISNIWHRLTIYSVLKVSDDSKDGENLKLDSCVSNLETEYAINSAFVQSEIAQNSDEFLKSLATDLDIKDKYDRFFESIIREKKHIINQEKEEMMAEISNFADFSSVYDKLTEIELKFDDIVTKDGERLTINNSNYGKYIKSPDADIRRQAHQNICNGYKTINLTLSQNYINYLKQSDFYARTYNFNSCIESAFFAEEVDKKVYETLIRNVHKNFKKYQGYLKAKAKVLGINKFLVSDILAPVGDGSKLNLEYNDAVDKVLETVSVMGEEYLNVATKNFTDGWVNAFQKEGKQSGAFSISARTGNPFMLLNYNYNFGSISTIAHELGHSMHSYFSETYQPFLKSNYVIFVAEVASTVNEVLLANKLIKESKNKEERKFIADSLLGNFNSTVFRQTMFSEFEEYAHGETNKKVPISFDELNNRYGELQRMYFGDSVILHDSAKYEWSRIPHFYRAFYVYKYATGFISAVAIAKLIETEGENYVKNHYIKFLSGGGSMDPVSLLKLAKVDITSDETYDLAFNYFDELLKIINE